LTEDARIEKTRYEIQGEDGLIWEIDEFHSRLTECLFTAEVEMREESIIPKIPSSIAEVFERDVTEEELYKNKNLAINGISPEKR
jgi:CYTH domain-containing protein